VDGKFFRLGEKKFFVKGVAYGPFAPNAQGSPFASPGQTTRDLDQIQQLGANVVRVYHEPPRWFLDLALERGIRVLVDIPWNKHLCFDSEARREEAREAVRRAVYTCGRHPAIFAFSVANEIPPDIVRWIGAKAAAAFIDDLVAEVKRADPDGLCTCANFPPTEFLRPQNLDFICFNVYLHNETPFRNYMAHLQILAESKPLVLGEFGVDSLREGEARKKELLSWQIESAFRGGLAGTIVFAFTDDWFRGGQLVEDWKMGLVTSDRQPKESFGAVQKAYATAPYFRQVRQPKVSVVVATYNGDRTLKACLDSLQRLNYPDYEIILVDDGSTDQTREIASRYSGVLYFRHEKNFGLSVARNTGILAATGEIIAFTDSDCRADEDWLYYLVADLLNSDFAGIGGPNLLPPEDSSVAAAVMASPGGPAHVMLTDRQAEHIPGCNMAFYKWALDEIGGFDPIFTRAGDDVDVCWRLQQAGHKIGFSPAAFVWHYRRSTIKAYLKQQRGYGEAEALLQRKHPENFNAFGGGIWRGRIYATSKFGVEIRAPVIYHGLFGSAGFQKLYASEPATMLLLATALEYHLFVTLPLLIVAVMFPFLLPLAIAGLLLPVAICAAAGGQAVLPKNKTWWWSRPLVALMFFVQPICRGWARYRGRLALRSTGAGVQESLDSIAIRDGAEPLDRVDYWSQQRIDRLGYVASILQRLDQKGWPNRSDTGWSEHDVEIYGNRWSHLHLTTVAEDHPNNHQMIRCRLRAVWSPTAKFALWSLLAFELLLIGLVESWRPWSWFCLLTLPLCFWLLWRDQRNLQSIITVLLDELAKERGLMKIQTRVRSDPPAQKAEPVKEAVPRGANSDADRGIDPTDVSRQGHAKRL
jgi:glycosyltransferase involved in cell wall biosynthesis